MTDISQGTPGPTHQAWQHVLAAAPPELRRWLENGKPHSLHADALVVAVANNFTRLQLEGRFRDRIEGALSEHFDRPFHFAVIVDESLTPGAWNGSTGPVAGSPAYESDDGFRAETNGRQETNGAPRTIGGPEINGQPGTGPPGRETDGMPGQLLDGYRTPPSPGVGSDDQSAPAFGRPREFDPPVPPDHLRPRRHDEARLNPKYLFETFVIGSSNRFAHAAAVAVAENPGMAFNPLTIYGDSGLGKTHLLHAIGRYIRQYAHPVRVRYVSTEELTNDFINAISQNKAADFRRRYREVDVLLIDDIQFLEGKEQTQEEFFHTFNTLHNAQKQIVMTSDRPPKLLENLEPRLRSRFGWGLITDVQPPDLETRIAILRKKAGQERLTAGPDVLEFIASKIQTNIRELEGALIRVTAFASLNRQQVDLALAEIVLKDLIPEGGEAQITSGLILAQTAAYYGFTIDDLCGQGRTQQVVIARQIAMYLCRELTDLSLPKIGQQFGGRDHTTVMHAERKVRTLLTEKRSVYNQVTELTNRIKQQASQR